MQTRSFLYIDECLEGTIRLTRSNWTGPVNIGSDVRGRNSDNRFIEKTLNWKPTKPVANGRKELYEWIEKEMQT